MNKFKSLGASLLAAIALVGLLQACKMETREDTTMDREASEHSVVPSAQPKQPNITLWQAMDALLQKIPLSKQGVETTLSTQLFEVADDGNGILHLFKSPPVALAEGVVISDLDLRLKRQGGGTGFLVLHIGGDCVTLDQIRSHYEPLKLTNLPSSLSPDDGTVYSHPRPWGELSFGFAQRNPKCLASIIFSPPLTAHP